MAFIFKLTAEGRNALINASHTGLADRTVVSVGITSTEIISGNPIDDEIKRINTISGEVVAEGTIHVTIRDESNDAYTVRGYGLYLENGVLLGSYGQAEPIINKTSASIMLLSTDARILDGSVDISILVFGDASFSNPPATTDQKGVIEIATQEEADLLEDDQRALVPARLKSLLAKKISILSTGSALPDANIGPIWHDDYQSIMTWQSFTANGANYNGYASQLVGSLLADTQQSPRLGFVASGATNLNRVSYASLRAWGMHNGLFVDVGIWVAGGLLMADNADGVTFRVYDVRGEFPRFFDGGRGVDPGRVWAAWQKGSLLYGNENADGQVHNFESVLANRAGMGWETPDLTMYSGRSAHVAQAAQINGLYTVDHYGVARSRNAPFAAQVKF